MASYRSIRNALLAVILLGIPVLLLRSATQDPQGLSGFDRTVRSIGAPLEAGVSYAAGSVGRFFERWVLQARLQEDNEQLEADNRKLRLELRALLSVEDENKELRRSLQMREKVPEDMIAAEISGVEQSPYFRVVKLQIDRGAAFVRPGSHYTRVRRWEAHRGGLARGAWVDLAADAGKSSRGGFAGVGRFRARMA